jgi:hypothetical protein
MAHFIDRKRIWKGDHFSLTVSIGGRMKTFLLWLLLASAAAPAVANATSLPFIQDDFAKARTQALRRKLPIFVECWAPW